jgi:GTP-binding protein YchF
MQAAVIGLLQSGKSTLVSAISGKHMPPVGTTAIEEAIVSVPDERIDWLGELHRSKKIMHATIDCLDVPGFNFADEHGRAAAKRYLQQIRTVELLVLVVRAFEDASVGPKADAAAELTQLRTELLLADLELVAKRIENIEKQMKKPGKAQPHDKAELELHQKLQATIEQEKPISAAIETDEEREMVKSLGFLTLKPIVVAVNVGENQLQEKIDLGDTLDRHVPTVQVCAKLAFELSQLDKESRAEFMKEMSISESTVSKFVRSCYDAIGLISFLTATPNEARAWPVKKGTTALEAAGKIHSDIQRGFIRAETVGYSDLKELGSEKAAKAVGKVRLEGKDYVVQDGDVILFRFNV